MLTYDDHLIAAVQLANHYLDLFAARGGEVFSYIIRAYRQFSVSSVDKRRELYQRRTSARKQPVYCRSRRSPGENNVVDNNHAFSGYIKVDPACIGCAAAPVVVAERRDVQQTRRDIAVFVFGDLCGYPLRQYRAAGKKSDKTKIIRAFVPLDYPWFGT